MAVGRVLDPGSGDRVSTVAEKTVVREAQKADRNGRIGAIKVLDKAVAFIIHRNNACK